MSPWVILNELFFFTDFSDFTDSSGVDPGVALNDHLAVFSLLRRSQTASVHFFGPYAINEEQNTIFFGRLQSHVFRLTPVTAGIGFIGVRAL